MNIKEMMLVNSEREAMVSLANGEIHPYDSPDEADGRLFPAIDWAHAAARGVIWELCGRNAIKNGFHNITEEVRKEIVEAMSMIIRVAWEKKGKSNPPS